MKRLTVVRHAKSSWDNPRLDDFDRPLNKRGERNAPEMGLRMKDYLPRPDCVVTSPALRAITTCRIICESVSFPHDHIQINEHVYEASAKTLLSQIRLQPDNCRHLMVFGHNPGLTNFINLLTDFGLDNLPTCGVFSMLMDVEHWTEAHPGCASMALWDYPKNMGGVLLG